MPDTMTERTTWWDAQPDTRRVSNGSKALREHLAEHGLDFQVATEPVTIRGAESDTWRAVVRQDTGDVYGVVRGRYEPVQHADALQVVDDVCDGWDARLDSLTPLNGGLALVAACQYKRPVDVGGADTATPWLLFSTSHDGKQSIRVGLTMVQLSCTNQIPGALGGGSSVSIVHSSQSMSRLAEASRAMDRMDSLIDAWEQDAGALAHKELTEARCRNIVEKCVARHATSLKQVSEDTDSIVALFSDSPTMPERFRGTAFGAVHAATEHFQHVRQWRAPVTLAREMTTGRAGRTVRDIVARCTDARRR